MKLEIGCSNPYIGFSEINADTQWYKAEGIRYKAKSNKLKTLRLKARDSCQTIICHLSSVFCLLLFRME